MHLKKLIKWRMLKMVEKIGNLILIKFLSMIIPNISDALRETLKESIKELKEKAQQSPNPYDDLFIKFLYIFFDIKDQ
jgi:hypothetical protein